jgi:hypothetical protein
VVVKSSSTIEVKKHWATTRRSLVVKVDKRLMTTKCFLYSIVEELLVIVEHFQQYKLNHHGFFDNRG